MKIIFNLVLVNYSESKQEKKNKKKQKKTKTKKNLLFTADYKYIQPKISKTPFMIQSNGKSLGANTFIQHIQIHSKLILCSSTYNSTYKILYLHVCYRWGISI